MILKNYLLTVVSHFWRNRLYAFINICSLAVGISATVLIFMYLRSEWRYDTHHKYAERLFRINTELKNEGTIDRMAVSNFLLSPTLLQHFPQEVENYARVLSIGRQTVTVAGKYYNEDRVGFADNSLFEIFDLPFEAGDTKKALSDSLTVVLSRQTAIKYFGSPYNAIGKTLKFPLKTYTVTGVLKPQVHDTHLSYELYLSAKAISLHFAEQCKKDVMWLTTYNYVQLREGISGNTFELKMIRLRNQYLSVWENGHLLPHTSLKHLVQPVSAIHLDMSYQGEYSLPTNPMYLYILSLIGGFILLMACINYMNLATARAGQRAQEVGLRKVLGANRRQLFAQFLGESFTMCLFSVWLGLAIAELLLPNFNYLAGKNFTQLPWFDMEFWGTMSIIVVSISMLAGLYPAVYLSSFPPTWVLQNKPQYTWHFGRLWVNPAHLRKGLVILQFGLSISMMIGTLIAYSQWDYMRTQPLGFDKDDIVVLDIPVGDSLLMNRMPAIRQKMKANPHVLNTAITSTIMDGRIPKIEHIRQKANKMTTEVFNTIIIDEQFIPLLKLQLKIGQNFTNVHPDSMQASVLINETAAKKLGWDNPLGKLLGNSFVKYGKQNNFDTTYCEIIGVVKDFHYQSLQHKIEPLVMFYMPKNPGFLLVKTDSKDREKTHEWIRQTWIQADNKHPIEYFELAQYIKDRYEPEGKLVAIFGYFSLLAIVISGLGLLGLTSYLTEQRTKEIGIRRVLGASAGEVVRQFALEFVWLVLFAFLLASPIVYVSMLRWLEGFAYHAQPSGTHFLIAGVSALCMAVATVSSLTWGVARRKPSSVLRYGG